VVNATPGPFTPVRDECAGDSVGPRVGLHGCRKSGPHRDSIPGTVQTVADRYTYRVTGDSSVRSITAPFVTAVRVLALSEVSVSFGCTSLH
jgi:hypothetical protein